MIQLKIYSILQKSLGIYIIRKTLSLYKCLKIRSRILNQTIVIPFNFIFIKAMFSASMESEKVNHERLTENSVETLLNKLLSLQIDSNEKMIKVFIKTENIKFG